LFFTVINKIIGKKQGKLQIKILASLTALPVQVLRVWSQLVILSTPVFSPAKIIDFVTNLYKKVKKCDVEIIFFITAFLKVFLSRMHDWFQINDSGWRIWYKHAILYVCRTKWSEKICL